MAVASALTYRYPAPSQCLVGASRSDVGLATSGGESPNPRFFDGLVGRPRQTAQAMLLVAKVARSRFYDPGLTARLEMLDPVVTAGGGRLRFESFSACCGVYARLDLLPDVLDDAFCGEGTTNVDFNPPMRQALGQVTDRTPMHLEVGVDAVAVSAGGAGAVERKVPLPERWVRGFAEVQVLLAGMVARHSLGAAAARRFLQSLPSGWTGREVLWAAPAGDGLRLSTRPDPAAVCLAAPNRLRLAADLGASVRGLRAYGPPPPPVGTTHGRGAEASAWEVQLDGARVWLVVSPDVSRGFSGEGGLLSALALGLPGAEEAALGRVGFDPAEEEWFPRLLPLDRAALEAGHPRLVDARRLVADGAVTLSDGGASIRTDDAVHRVTFADPFPRCTCPWFAKHRGERGPCKHVLAATVVRAGVDRPEVAWHAPR